MSITFTRSLVIAFAVLSLCLSSDGVAQKKKSRKKKQEQKVELNIDSLARVGVGEGPAAPISDVAHSPEPDREEYIEVDSPPEPIDNIARFIVYPELAKRLNVEGKVIIAALVNEQGIVTKTLIDQSSNKMFDQATIDAMTKVKFKPAMRNGKPLKAWYSLPVEYRLNY
jgi:TonB family protein